MNNFYFRILEAFIKELPKILPLCIVASTICDTNRFHMLSELDSSCKIWSASFFISLSIPFLFGVPKRFYPSSYLELSITEFVKNLLTYIFNQIMILFQHNLPFPAFSFLYNSQHLVSSSILSTIWINVKDKLRIFDRLMHLRGIRNPEKFSL